MIYFAGESNNINNDEKQTYLFYYGADACVQRM